MQAIIDILNAVFVIIGIAVTLNWLERWGLERAKRRQVIDAAIQDIENAKHE